jgi:signal transduction histidine kinase/ActR/RegA family two-component response regulator
MTSKKNRPEPGAGETSRTPQDLPAWSCDEARYADDSTVIVLTRQQRERQAFHIITEAAVSNAELPAICQKILTDLLSVLDFDFATLRLYDPATRLLNLTAIAGQRVQAMMDKFPAQSIDDPHYVGAFVARERKPVIAPEVDHHAIAETHALRVREIGLKGIIAYPITSAAGDLIGVVQLNAGEARSINPGDRTFFEAVARMFGTIIEHRRAVDRLRESEAGYRSLFENAPAALWVADFSEVKVYLNRLRASGTADLSAYFNANPGAVAACAARIKVLDVNQQALELYQAQDKQVLKTGLSRILTAQSFEALARELVIISAGGKRSSTEIENLTLSGEQRRLVMQWFVAPGHESDYGRVFLSFLDVTATRALEAQLLQSQKMESVGTLAGGIAHDFNNIMQAISGYAQLMLWDRNPGDGDYDNLRAIEKAADRANKLTRQLLTFSRKVPIALKPTDLNAEIEGVCKLLARTIPKMIHIEKYLAADLYQVNADRSQIEQVLMNLSINASNAMPDGGRLVFETVNVDLDRTYGLTHPEAHEGPHVLLSISDTGHGMNAETQRRVFEPFFTTGEIGQGSGLGLAMVYGIIKNHNGHILCYSTPGQGACFKIYLPAIPGPQAMPAKEADQAQASPHGTETILVVDDEPVILNLAETILKRFGYTVFLAESGEQALAFMTAQVEPVDLVILDLNMPGMGGHGCLEALKAHYPDLPVLIASGYSPNGSVRDTLSAGAAGFIGKPYQLKEMLKVVRDIIDAGSS